MCKAAESQHTHIPFGDVFQGHDVEVQGCEASQLREGIDIVAGAAFALQNARSQLAQAADGVGDVHGKPSITPAEVELLQIGQRRNRRWKTNCGTKG